MKIPKQLLAPMSVGVVLLDLIEPGVLNVWESKVEEEVQGGKFTKIEIAYLPFHPPPALYSYKCSTCHWWIEPGECKVVRGEVSPVGWCILWVPNKL